jgi:LmbE family N-acetylglucosaminyl deacetylase
MTMYGTMHLSHTALASVVGMAITLMATPGFAANARQPSAGELMRAIDRLGVVGNVLYVAAHPDDENTRLLAWLANDKLVRAGYLSLTRGEGGQNLIGPEQAPLLGLIRTEELLAARSIDRAEQWFTRARDFGYSKTPDETLRIWDREAILADVATVMKKFRPDVVITRFPPEGAETHGHHTASAMLAVEAFKTLDAASRPKRVVWNRFNFGGPPPKGDELAQLSHFSGLDVGGFNALLGLSYGEMAAQSRSMHKSQGFGVAPSRGEQVEYFRVLAGEPAAHSIFDGLDLTWGRVPGGKKIGEHVARIRAAFSPTAPARSIPELVALRGEMQALADHPWKAEKLAELDDVIAGCAGLYAEAAVGDIVANPGGDVTLTVTAINRSPAAMTLREVRLPGGERVTVDKPLGDNKPVKVEHTFKLPAETEISQPYWLAAPPDKGHWTVRDPALIGRPETAAPSAELVVAVGGATLTLERPLAYKWVDPVAGERQRALEVLPPVSVTPRAPLLVFPDAAAVRPLGVRVKANRDGAAGEVAPELPAGWSAEPKSAPFKLAKKGDEVELTFKVHPPRAEATATLRLVATVDGQRWSRALGHVEYAHIPIQTVTPDADVKLVRADIHHKRTHIGYIAGAGDEVPAALRQAGYDVTTLTEEMIAHGSLAPYQAIVTGVRAFNVDARLPYLHDRLMKYVADGGTMVVQYNTQNFISSITAPIGPAPFKITHDRVTEEDAAVQMLAPQHALVNVPNKIGERDFAGWVQERGLYFADDWDKAFTPIFAMHDTGEPARKGSLIVTKHGKGAFVYTGLAFFRQLPAGVPGAYRLFANLLDYAP